ncbi:hypothetical protein, partial [Arthrobacter nitrophenolicus]|uniref:hypothetical protein n=1 Tax=Arthrobacter nitrophenolicus TaxID=683150 RepID=UPI00197ACC84
FETSCKTKPMPQGRHDPAIQPITLHNRYQQTWHTIEFSNNRHTRHHHQHHSQRIAPEQLFKLTRWLHSCQTGGRDLHQREAFWSGFPADSVDQRGNKLYHHSAAMANSPGSRFPPRTRGGMEKPGIARIPGRSMRVTPAG